MDRGSDNQHDKHAFPDDNKEIWNDDKGILAESFPWAWVYGRQMIAMGYI